LKRLSNIFEGATEGANHSFTSEGGKHNRRTNVSPAKHITTLNTKFPFQTKTPARCAVTPYTPHVMVRRSARQQHNLSQDMMAETINRANHFSPSRAHPKTQNSKTWSSNKEVIIRPEMANAVICPECKSLKHQELITKLRYKIKWMRSTANKINRLYNTNTIRFIPRSNIPKGRKVTYVSFVVDIKDNKEGGKTDQPLEEIQLNI
jgi:hypothetical protein